MSGKILVTGGAGYIGAHTVVALVQAGYMPIIVDDLSRSNDTLLKGIEQVLGFAPVFYKVDCKNYDQLRKVFLSHRDIECAIHFAAFKSVGESVREPGLYYQNNIGSLVTLLQVMKEFRVTRLVFSSSCTVYGQPDVIPVTESSPFKRAESAYGATKQMCERILEDEVVSWPEFLAVSLRYFNPIGAHSSGFIGELPLGTPSNLVPFITQTAIGRREKLTVFGSDYNTPDGSCLRDYIHVMDVSEAHVKALEKMIGFADRYNGINLGSGVPVSVLELVNKFMQVTGIHLPYTIGPRRPGDVEKVYADPSLSTSLLRWKTKRTIEEGLRDAWNWEQKISRATH